MASQPPAEASLDRIATVPNLLSAIRIVLIPVFVILILHHGTEMAGLLLLGGVVSTDWVDGYLARRTGQVSNLGKVLDPVADRLAIAAALVALVARDAVPLWAALLVLVRDAVVLVAGAIVLARYRVRLDVRWIGKAATFDLMWGIPLIAWGRFGLFLHGLALPAGWILYGIGITLYYVAAVIYGGDLVRAVRHGQRGGGTGDRPVELG
ncbi:MAG TPA: CDP-alcohol phosphatidyltransferase family protein [Actinomycetota bacterium]|nr:CDP-alcohol phosphatidyltransferase family protein [Actinomycetota bacterium]